MPFMSYLAFASTLECREKGSKFSDFVAKLRREIEYRIACQLAEKKLLLSDLETDGLLLKIKILYEECDLASSFADTQTAQWFTHEFAQAGWVFDYRYDGSYEVQIGLSKREDPQPQPDPGEPPRLPPRQAAMVA